MTTLAVREALLPQGFARDVLLSVGLDGTLETVEAEVARERFEAAGLHLAGVALPGVSNLHSHTFQRGFSGLAERRGGAEDHFWTWREAMYRFASRITPDDAEALAALAFVEMLESGFTAVAEFLYVHHAPGGRPYDDPAEMGTRIAAAAEATGIGLTLLPVFYARGGFGGAPPLPEQARFISGLDLYPRMLEGSARAIRRNGRVGVAPHSLRAVTPNELAAVTALATGPIHIHIAEQTREVDDCLQATGSRPVAWLLDQAHVDARWCLVHATHVDAVELRRLAASGATVGLCPITEANLGDGLFPAAEFLAANGRFGVGSDSNVEITLAGELRLLEYGQRLRDRARNRLAAPDRSTGRTLFEAALAGGGAALGRGSGLAPGQPADLVVLDPDHPALVGRRGDALLDSWIFGDARGAVRDVVAAGRHVVKDGVHVSRPEVERRWRAIAARLAP